MSAALGLGWCVTRVAYTIGYCREDKEKGEGRWVGGGLCNYIEFALMAGSGMVGYKMVVA